MLVLKYNKTLSEAKEIKKSGRMTALCYLLYAIVMSASGILLDFNNVVNLLLANVLSAIACVAFMAAIARRSFASLGMNSGILDYPLGWMLSAVILFIIWLINIVFHAVNTSVNQKINLRIFLLLLIGFIFQGFMEEFIMRSLLFTQLALRFGVIAAILLNSSVFALMHIANANASVISLVNTFLIGILFSLIYYYHDNIWLVAGFHSGWNFILGAVLGVSVSGFELPTTVFKTEINENLAVLNGGLYGFEAGSPVTVIIVLMIVIYILLLKNNSQKLIQKSD
jgi:hypothetical protein